LEATISPDLKDRLTIAGGIAFLIFLWWVTGSTIKGTVSDLFDWLRHIGYFLCEAIVAWLIGRTAMKNERAFGQLVAGALIWGGIELAASLLKSFDAFLRRIFGA
jgi:hypothetical protein